MRVLIVSGGSGGHIFPAIAVCRELAKVRDAQILFAASRRRLDTTLLKKEHFRKTFFFINPMPRKISFGIFIFLAKIFMDTLKSLYLLLKYRPHIVVGFGGYTGAPLVAASSLMHIPTLIHEQNVVPGRANKALDSFADRVCISFEESRFFFKNNDIVYTGNPIRSSLSAKGDRGFQTRLGLARDRFTILVMGGSQGARSLNKLATEAIGELKDGIKRDLQVIHIAGRFDYEMVRKAYEKNNIQNRTYRFMDRIEDAYRACDLAISRAGASACFELALFNKPALLVPFPHRDNTQRFNAEAFARSGACIYKEERELSGGELKYIIEDLIKNDAKRQELSSKISLFSKPDAARRLASEIIKLASSHAQKSVLNRKQC